MMTEKYPTWLTGHVKEWAQKRLSTVTLCSTTGNELLEVWYYGDLLTVKGDPQSYIVDGLSLIHIYIRSRRATHGTLAIKPMLGWIRTADWYTPVSYTHLDVYKRQVLRSLRWPHFCSYR